MGDEHIRDFTDRLARMEEKIDGLREDKVDNAARHMRHGIRLDRLERFVWIALGAATVSAVPQVVTLANAMPAP